MNINNGNILNKVSIIACHPNEPKIYKPNGFLYHDNYYVLNNNHYILANNMFTGNIKYKGKNTPSSFKEVSSLIL